MVKQIKITPTFTNRDDLSIRLYFKDIQKYQPLSLEQEIALSYEIKKGNQEALNKLVNSNLRFVITVAKQYQGQGLSLVDLISEGNVGLVRAAKLYNGDKGFKFISYAVWWIRQAILTAIYNVSKTIRSPITHATKISKINKAINKLEAVLDRPPSTEEISQESNLSEETINDTITNSVRCSSIETKVKDDESGITLEDMIAGDSKTDESLINESKLNEINFILSKLPYREQDMIRMYFGLGMHSMTLEEISNKFGMTTERVRQLKEHGLEILRTKYSEILKDLL